MGMLMIGWIKVWCRVSVWFFGLRRMVLIYLFNLLKLRLLGLLLVLIL